MGKETDIAGGPACGISVCGWGLAGSGCGKGKLSAAEVPGPFAQGGQGDASCPVRARRTRVKVEGKEFRKFRAVFLSAVRFANWLRIELWIARQEALRRRF